MIVYFTGTGNSRYCAKALAERLGDELMDSFRFIRDGAAAELYSDKPWIFVAPTYSWQMPRLFEDFIRHGSFSGSREAYFLLTCGGHIGDAGARLEALCREKGFSYRGVMPVVMPNNYIVLSQAPSMEKARQIIRRAHPTLDKAAACIRDGRSFPLRRTGALDRLKSGPVNAGFYRFFLRANPFHVADGCTGCGQCQDACVERNISLRDGRPVWGDRCVQCMACINLCPAQAVEYGRATRGRERYRCPDYPV